MTNQHWKRWGTELRHHRVRAGMAQATLGKLMKIAGPTVGAFERAIRVPRREYAVAADTALATGGALAQLWDDISDIREIPQDWHSFEKVELQAAAIREYHATLVPGLLQIPEYARTVLRNTGVWSKEQVDRLTDARTARLDNLGEVALTFVVDEVVLRRGHGSWDILRAQLDHIRRLIDQRGMRFLVIPQTTLFHPSLAGSFRILTLRDGRFVGQEEYVSGVNVATGPTTEQLVTLFGHLQGEALSLQDSVELLDTIRREL